MVDERIGLVQGDDLPFIRLQFSDGQSRGHRVGGNSVIFNKKVQKNIIIYSIIIGICLLILIQLNIIKVTNSNVLQTTSTKLNSINDNTIIDSGIGLLPKGVMATPLLSL